MKIFTNKKIVQKIIIAILIVLSFNFIMPTYSRADPGGILMGPVIDFFAGVGDMILAGLQYWMYDGDINFGTAVGGAVDSVVTLVNPWDSFLLMRSSENFEAKLSEYDMNPDGPIDITIDSDQFDKGWLSWLPGALGDKDFGVPIIKYTPEAIFGNDVPALDVNFINPKDWGDTEKNEHSITQTLHDTIASWYIALRNLALVILLSVLLYVGIRMVISSTASDKAKYKQMIVDWIVAVCILFFLHYIMSFILSVTEVITDGITVSTSINVSVTGEQAFQMKTNLTGLVRLQVQYKDLGARLIYLIFYLALVIYTAMFTWTYIKRAITMAFLTLMAPLVAITYPIDKIGDGQAQAFGIWLREFIFNSLLQPFHLIIYSIFMGAGSEIAVKNPIYAILFLAFIIPAEKLLRKMFGFDKSNTAGAMNTAAGILGGAAAFKAISNIVGKGAGKGKGNKGSTSTNIRTKKPIEGKSPSATDAFGGGRLTAGTQTAGTPVARAGAGQVPANTAGLTNQPQNNGIVEDTTIGAGPGRLTNSGIWVPNSAANVIAGNGENISQATRQRMARLQNNYPAPSPSPAGASNANMGIGAWTRNAWNNSNLKSNLDHTAEALKNSKYVRTIGAGARSARDMAQGLYNGAGNMAKGVANKVGNVGRGISNRIENRAPGLQQALKNSARGFVGKAAPVVKGAGAVLGRAGISAGKTAIKGLGVGTMAAIGTTVGLAAGIAGDDLEDVLHYGLAGGVLGATGLPAVGANMASSAINTAGSYRVTYEQGAYGIEEAELRRQAREWKKAAENKEAMVKVFVEMNGGRKPSSKELTDLMNSGVEYYNIGIAETKDIGKALKLEQEIKAKLTTEGMDSSSADELARMQAMFVAKRASEYSKTDLRDDKKVESLRKDISKQLEQGGMTREQAQNQSKGIVNMIKKHKGVATD